ncbi:MAG: hypothetical protein EU541_02890 [Promethearchaeota archaeon]|nr:MAG: hypothetical protein EU541_02890 [Candidatus Lokiarchaeota archaeon]
MVIFTEISTIMFLIIWPLFPIIYPLMILPVIILIDMNYSHRKRYMQAFAQKLNISGPLNDPLS